MKKESLKVFLIHGLIDTLINNQINVNEIRRTTFLLVSILMIWTSCSEEAIRSDNEKGNQVNEKIQSLKSAQTVNDIKKVYQYIVTEKDFSDAIGILTESGKLPLLELLPL